MKASGILNDWSWKPDGIASSALKRGDAKRREFLIRGREVIIDLHAHSRIRRPKISKKKLAAQAAEVEALRGYVRKRKVNNWSWTGTDRDPEPVLDRGVAKSGGSKRGENNRGGGRQSKRRRGPDAGPRGADGGGSGGDQYQVQPAEHGGAMGVDQGVSGRKNRETRGTSGAAGADSQRPDDRRDEGVDSMTWATVIVPNMSGTRVVYRAADSKLAIKWAEEKEIKDYIVVAPGYKFTGLSTSEMDAILKQFGDTRMGLKVEEKAKVVEKLLSLYDPQQHDKDGAARPGSYPETKPVVQESAEVATVKAKAGKKAAKKGKTLAAKPAKKREQKGDGLGREGTPARFIRELYKSGKDTAAIFAAAVKKFPKNDIKSTSYVSWYKNDMVKKGLLKKTA